MAENSVSSNTRYVWVDRLTLRSQPDSKSAQVATLAKGAELIIQPDSAPLIGHQETAFKLAASEAEKQATVTIDGAWQRVRYQNLEGWVFDGFLSRYPFPPASSEPDPLISTLDYAKNVFGAKQSLKWTKGDSSETPSYRAMRKRWKFDVDEEKNASEISWNYVDFKMGGNFESLTMIGDGSSGDDEFNDIPITFNEALLWIRQFYQIGGGGIVGSGKFTPGKSVEFGPTDDDNSGLGFRVSIECSLARCSVQRSVVD